MESSDFARLLRRRTTNAERHLWRQLRGRRFSGWKFRRQHPIGRWVSDFCCIEARLVLELDGGQHASSAVRDGKRTAGLEAAGYRVLRFWDNDVLTRTEAVLEEILRELRMG